MKNWEYELKNDNIWRAKEILQGHIRQAYRPDEYLAYGKLLFELKDYYEAGKYLLAGGAQINGKYHEAIEIFLKRNHSVTLSGFMSRFTHKFSKAPYKTLPCPLIEYIENRFDPQEIERYKIESNKPTGSFELSSQTLSDTIKERLEVAAWIALALFGIASMIVGAYTILHWVSTHFG